MSERFFYHDSRIRCIEANGSKSLSDGDEIFWAQAKMVGDIPWDTALFLDFVLQCRKISTLYIQSDIENSLSMIEEVRIRDEEIAKIITRPITTTDTYERIIDSFLKQSAECWEDITRCEVTRRTKKNESFHRNSISIFVKIEKSIHSRAYLCLFSSHSSESLCRFLPLVSM